MSAVFTNGEWVSDSGITNDQMIDKEIKWKDLIDAKSNIQEKLLLSEAALSMDCIKVTIDEQATN